MHQHPRAGLREKQVDSRYTLEMVKIFVIFLMCGIKLSSESKITPRFFTDCDGLKSFNFGKSFSFWPSGPMTETSVLSWLSCRKFAAIHVLISKVQLKRTWIGPVSSGDAAMYSFNIIFSECDFFLGSNSKFLLFERKSQNFEGEKSKSFTMPSIYMLKLGSVMFFRNTFCYTRWNDPAILRVVNTLCIQKRNKNNQTSVAALGLRKIWPIRAVRPGHHRLVRCLHVSSSVPLRVHTLHFTDARNIQCTPLQKYELQEKKFIWLQWQARKRKPEAEKAAKKKAPDKERSRWHRCSVWEVETIGACEGLEKWCRGCSLSVRQVIMCLF